MARKLGLIARARPRAGAAPNTQWRQHAYAELTSITRCLQNGIRSVVRERVAVTNPVLDEKEAGRRGRAGCPRDDKPTGRRACPAVSTVPRRKASCRVPGARKIQP